MAAIIILLVLVIILLVILFFASYKRTHRTIDNKIMVSINGGEYKELESSPERRAKMGKRRKTFRKTGRENETPPQHLVNPPLYGDI